MGFLFLFCIWYFMYNYKFSCYIFLITADNGLNPVWNDSCEFDVKNPELALLRFVVQDEDMFGDSNFIGQGTYPVCKIYIC